MLRISVTPHPGGATVTLEGRLAGPWVDELRTCWRALGATQHPRSIRIALDAVTFIDTAGKALLWAMHEQGAVLAATGCMTRAIVDEIRRKSFERRGLGAEGKGNSRAHDGEMPELRGAGLPRDRHGAE